MVSVSQQKKRRENLLYKRFDANGTKTFPKENQLNDERDEVFKTFKNSAFLLN